MGRLWLFRERMTLSQLSVQDAPAAMKPLRLLVVSASDHFPSAVRHLITNHDIEIDHVIMTDENPLAENCRLVVCGGPGGTGQAAMFARYDQSLTLLSTWDFNQPGGGTCNNPPSNDGARFLIFDPVEHEDDPGTTVDEETCRHAMWVGDAGTSAGNMVLISDGRPMPDDWDGWG